MPSDSSKRRAKTASAGANQLSKSDEDILKDRKRMEAFDTADTYLGFLGYGFWALAFVWFTNFTDAQQAIPSMHHASTDTCLVLFVVGGFCRGISRASPRLWSTWRLLFHFAWCPVLAVMALAAASMAMQKSSVVSSNVCWLIALGCGAGAAVAVLTFPGSSLGSAKGSDAYLARLLLCMDGLAGTAVAASVLISIPWSDGLGPITAAMTAAPWIACSAALSLCCTDAELLVAVPWVMIFLIGASLRALYFSGTAATIPTAGLLLLHVGLYLPLGDSETNPFYMSLARFARQIKKFMSQPVSGFGDEGAGD